LLALPDGERRYTDLMHLAELLHAEALHKRRGPRALLDWYRRMRAGEAQRVGMARDDVQIRLESDAHAVTLTTIHKSKGLQFPIVYCPFAWDGTLLQQHEQNSPQFHDREQADRLTLVLPSGGAIDPAQRAAAEREALAEQLRLLYVALTRAQHRLSVVWGALGKFEQSALAYLLHQARPVEADAIDALRQQTAERAKALSDAALLADLAQLVEHAQGTIEVRALHAGPGQAFSPRGAVAYALAPLIAPALTSLGLSVSSFSRLAAQEADLAGLDRDEHADAPSGAEPSPQLPPVPLADFPAGANFGHLIHAIYETADFQVAAADDLRESVANALADYGAAAAGERASGEELAQWQARLSEAIFDTLHTPLTAEIQRQASLVDEAQERSLQAQPALSALQTALSWDAAEPPVVGVPSLASVANARRLSELEFLFPVGRVEADSPLTAESLAQVLRRHARDASERAYAERLAGLRFVPFRGFMRGFIDLVFEHDGRFFIADYKSNRLGPSAADYRPERLRGVMQRHHYVLQYLVYCVALHRYLALRLPGYAYERHFGGIYYLFVRGMSRGHAPGSGVFFDRPEAALIEQLSRRFAAPESRS
jgi:exodeoxyribonuclease V beta subunit